MKNYVVRMQVSFNLERISLQSVCAQSIPKGAFLSNNPTEESMPLIVFRCTLIASIVRARPSPSGLSTAFGKVNE